MLPDRILGATLYSYPEGEDEEGADRRVGEIAELLETANPVAGEDIRVMDDFLAPGYGRLNPPTVEAGGWLLVVYTGGTPVAAPIRRRSCGGGGGYPRRLAGAAWERGGTGESSLLTNDRKVAPPDERSAQGVDW